MAPNAEYLLHYNSSEHMLLHVLLVVLIGLSISPSHTKIVSKLALAPISLSTRVERSLNDMIQRNIHCVCMDVLILLLAELQVLLGLNQR